jgi:two-component system chemotaxis response regulator CheY
MGKHILIVDDSESIRELVSLTLSSEGYQLTVAINGKDALDKLITSEDKVDLILSDLNMPIMDGISFLKHVRLDEKYKFIPFLMLTTETLENKKTEAKQSGATGWIIKPFVKDKLLAVIQKVLR